MKSNLLFSIMLIAFLGFFKSTISQTPTWKWVKWSDGTQTTVRSMCTDAAGNLYVVGSFYDLTKFDTSILSTTGNGGFIAKYSSSGVIQWTRKIKNPNYAAADCKGITIDQNGSIYITGAYTGTIQFDSKTLTGGGHYVASYNNNGAILWAVNTTSSNTLVADNSGVYVAGGSIIQKHDATGAISWTITGVKTNVGYTNFFSIALNPAGNLIVSGDIDDTWTFDTKSIIGGYQNIILMEFSKAGAVNWIKKFGSNSNGGDHAQALTTDDSGNIIMTGKVGGASMFDGVSLGSNSGYLVKLNPIGLTLWGTVLTKTENIYGNGGISVCADINGAVYVTGGCGGFDVTDGGSKIYVTNRTGLNAFVLKFSADGTFKWAQTNKVATTVNSRGMALASNSGGIYFGGVCSPASEWGALKVTGYGSVFAIIDDGTLQSTKINPINYKQSILIYPNPNSGHFIIEAPNALKHSATLNIINSMGVTVFTTQITGNKSWIDLSNYPKGIYFALIKTEQGENINTKIIVE